MTMTFPITDKLDSLLRCISDAGGKPVIVGGSVRDYLLGLTPKDIDVEVFGLQSCDLEAALNAKFEAVDAVGRSFGVLKVTIEGETFDVSLPRTESKRGTGHRGFVVTSDPFMSFQDAAARRDFTINAMGWDYQTKTLLDPWGGQHDLAHKRICHVGPAFAEDPLRVLRACQFAARFGFEIAGETIELCRKLQPELATLSIERFWEEWKKLLLKARHPSIGLFAMYETGVLELFPELKALLHVAQDPEWHPEGQDHPLGSLWVHNCMVTDGAARVLRDDDVLATEGEDSAMVLMLGALCHDLGKPAVTEFSAKKSDPDGPKRWRAHAHEEAGVEPTRSFLARIGCPPGIIERVVPLVAHHLKPFHFARDKASDSAIRRLSIKAPLKDLCRVARADFLGRTTPDALATKDSREIPEVLWLLGRAAALKVDPMHGVEPFLKGRHLIDLGLRPGPQMGKLIKESFEAQLDGSISDELSAIEWARGKLAA
jgi:tRNA nucleotidyltransferase (CCA-adding enzyme)